MVEGGTRRGKRAEQAPEGLSMTGGEWPSTPESADYVEPMGRIAADSELHDKVRDYLVRRLEMSEREMKTLYDRWRVNEKKITAYIALPDYEKVLSDMNDSGKPPQVVSVVLPHAFATVNAIVTYLLQVFCGREPIFQVDSARSEHMQNARNMEKVLQYNAQHTGLVRTLYQLFLDGEVYGLGVVQTAWKQEKQFRTKRVQEAAGGWAGMLGVLEDRKVREMQVVYSGNAVTSVDPFCFFPDPRVPMAEVGRKGEFVFWRSFEGVHSLKKREAEGELVGVAKAGQAPSDSTIGESARNMFAGGRSSPGSRLDAGNTTLDFVQVDQGTVEIIPAELGLGTSTVPEKWLFTVLNKRQVVQAEQFEADHGEHPVVVSEPYSLGYGFANAGIADYLGPLQDMMSWLVNSHIDNVRAALNNLLVADPTMIEMQDLLDPQPGGIIRMKPAMTGRDVRAALTQLNIVDVTGRHMVDVEAFSRAADALTGVTDNLRGLQDSGGRKTATEVRTSSEAAASRLAAHARLISAMAICPLARQMSLNIQQFMDDTFYFRLLGEEGMQAPVQVGPEELAGDFTFPIHDGTLPVDRVAMLDVWKQIFQAVLADPQLRQSFDIVRLFEWLAQLGGAQNLGSFKMQMQGQGMMGQGMPGMPLPGQGMPLPGQAMPGQGEQGMSPIPGVVANPGDRMAGGI